MVRADQFSWNFGPTDQNFRRTKISVTEPITQFVIPEELRAEVLADLHEGAMGGHLGVDKTLSRVKERFYWPGHYNDVQDWCGSCSACASRKNPSPKARAPLTSIKTGYPLQIVAMDIVGPFPESQAGNTHILVVADYFTRWMEAYPLPNQEAATVAKKLVDEFFFRFSPPEQLHSDQGRNFESDTIAEVCKLLGVLKTRTTPYHPQSDGLVERFNRTLLNMLATAAQEKPFDWENHLYTPVMHRLQHKCPPDDRVYPLFSDVRPPGEDANRHYVWHTRSGGIYCVRICNQSQAQSESSL